MREPISSTSAIPGRARSGRRPIMPVGREPDEYDVTFELDKVTFRRRDGDFETLLQVAVSPEDDVEVRRLSITNHGDRPREIEVTSYAEIVLGRPEDDLAHPAFGKLFIETEHDAQNAGLFFSRRPRSAHEEQVWGFHVLGVDGRLGGAVEWETDRAHLPRTGPIAGQPRGARRSPAVGFDRRRARSGGGAARPGAAGARRLRPRHLRDRRRPRPRHRPRARQQVPRWQRRVARFLDGLHARAGHAAAPRPHRRPRHALRPRGIAGVRLRRLVHRARRTSRANTLAQPNLWGFGISGDLPIVLVRVGGHGAGRPGPPDAARAGVLARQGPARRRGRSSTSTRPTISTKCRRC